jgi:hypothetical protein
MFYVLLTKNKLKLLENYTKALEVQILAPFVYFQRKIKKNITVHLFAVVSIILEASVRNINQETPILFVI